MGRNDLCFCGSGKKEKKCHPDLNENSMAANLLKLYNKIDTKINEHYADTGNFHKCKKGCAQCCYMQTRISEIEYNLIQYELLKWSESELQDLSVRVKELWDTLNKKHPALIKQLCKSQDGQVVNFSEENGNYLDAIDVECPFLDLSTNTCMIYNVRPFVCRVFGVSFNNFEADDFMLCENLNITELIEFGYNAKDFTDDVRKLFVWKNDGQVLGRRPFPIIYFLYKSFYGDNKNIGYINNFLGKFQLPEKDYIQAVFNYTYKK